MTHYACFESAMGRMYATVEGDAISGIYFEGGRHAPTIRTDWIAAPDHDVLRACMSQLQEYFAGTRSAFDLPLHAGGTPFQAQVWKHIAAIPYGETVTYASLAATLGKPAAARAVGAATGRNPHSIVVPCHRVLGSDGSATGYAGGVERKLRMLGLERRAR
jgi:methylated-DNA-[protein]-cysteine S-methyltransferase